MKQTAEAAADARAPGLESESAAKKKRGAEENSKPDVAEQATLDPELSDSEKTPGSGMVPGSGNEAPSG